MTRVKRTKQKRVSVHSGREPESLHAFDIELVMVGDGADPPIGSSTINPVGTLVYKQTINFKDIPPLPNLKAFVSSQRHPESGAFDQTCQLKTNYLVIKMLKDEIHQYNVHISPEVSSCDISRAVMRELVSLHRHSDLSGFHPVYDGRKHLYTAGALPFRCKTFEVKLQNQDGDQQAPWRVAQFEVVVEFAALVGLKPLMNLVGGQEEKHQVALQVLDIILREIYSGRRCPFTQPVQLGDGLEIYQDLRTSLKLTQKGLLLNVDLCSTIKIKHMHVIDYISQLLDKEILAEPLCAGDRLKIEKALKGVLVQFRDMHRKYPVLGLTSHLTKDLFVPSDDCGTRKAFVQYFQEIHDCDVKYTSLPCLEVGSAENRMFLPFEVCKIAEGQRYSKELNQKQMSALQQAARMNPQQREQYILRTMDYNNCFEDPFVKEFGIEIEKKFLSLEAHVLPPPWLKFSDNGVTKRVLPLFGQWNMIRKRMFSSGRVNSWACVNFALDVGDKIIRSFCHELTVMCKASGIDFAVDSVLPVITASPEDVECTLKTCHQDAMEILGPQGKGLDLLIVVLPDHKGSLYGNIKRICETDIGLVSQCCLAKNVLKTSKQLKLSKKYLANLALKINVKAGGRNAVLLDALTGRLPCVCDVPTIIFGAHVMHPGNGSPHSIAAVVASQDWPEVTKYAALAGLQAHCQEAIQDLFQAPHDFERGAIAGGMIMEHLISFYISTGQKPQRIIFYRDAVSDGQLYKVMWQELVAIKKACSCLEPDYNPPVTYVVLQKRYCTRFFHVEHDDDLDTLINRNALAGTVVDSGICPPNESGFYLCSQDGPTQGMTRPVYYHIMWDENRFTTITFQCLTNYLCYTNARCTNSVSIVPPVCYAQLMASRGRLYMEPSPSQSEPMTSESSHMASGASVAAFTSDDCAMVPCLPAVKDNVKNVMFYC